MPKVSVVIPAHNEAALIEEVVRSVTRGLDEAGADGEIIVVDDASTDDTGTRAASMGAHVIRVDRRQIAAVRNEGARIASGEWLVFVDGDTIAPPATLAAALEALESGAVGGGCAVDFDGDIPWWARRMLPLFLLLFRIVKMAAGCFLFCRRADFEAVGGFDETLYASEEAALSAALRRRGRFVVLRETVLTSGRKLRTHHAGEIWWTAVRCLLRGGPRRALGRREGLDIWYGPRRPDPHLEGADEIG